MNNVFGLISNYCNYGIQKDNAISHIFDRLLTSSFKIRVIVNQLHIKLLSVYYFGSKYISSCPLEFYSFIVIFIQPINKLNYQRFCSSSVKNGSSFLNLIVRKIDQLEIRRFFQNLLFTDHASPESAFHFRECAYTGVCWKIYERSRMTAFVEFRARKYRGTDFTCDFTIRGARETSRQ